MKKLKIKKKYIFLGDIDSINIELITKSFNFLKHKVEYILICNKIDFLKKSNLIINEILDPITFKNYKRSQINIFNVENISQKKYLNLLNQIKISNQIANITKFDLITMPINKAIFKKKIEFVGMTEYLGKLNQITTLMLMHGDKFSIIPMTTHINLKDVSKYIQTKIINSFLKNIFLNIENKKYKLNFKNIKFLCFNPHCGEDGTLGNEDIKIQNTIKKFNKIKGPYSGDSIFIKIEKNTLFISTYHDQALIAFKILNKKSVNITLGLNYRRLSPAHGTAREIKNKFIADNTSYLTCLLF
jgi:4-hydroxythreonine-4-phosphate dehydrogenase